MINKKSYIVLDEPFRKIKIWFYIYSDTTGKIYRIGYEEEDTDLGSSG